MWNEEKQSICGVFQLTPEEAQDLEQISLSELTTEEVRALAAKVRDHLLRGFNARCFIIMPFDEVIRSTRT